MKHELKIIMSYETEDMDCDQTTPISNGTIRVFLDNKPIGCIQEMTIQANANEFVPFIEFAFPDIEGLDYDIDAYKSMFPHSKQIPFIRDIKENVSAFKMIPNVRVKMNGIDNGENIVHLEEVGTDGFIDSIPMKRRHK